jgi:hypothetical protein
MNARVRNLSSATRTIARLIRFLAGMIASSTFLKLTAAERAAVEALKAACDAVLALLPAPGTDNDPSTVE